MSKLGLEHSLERLLEAGAKKIEPVIREDAKFVEHVIEGVVADQIVKKLDPATPTPAKDAPATATKPHSPEHPAVPVTPAAGATLPVSTDHGQSHDAQQSVGLGSTGAAVRELQRDLGVSVDGIDGPQTTAALKAFQRSHGLQPDGIAGPKTWPVLRAEPTLHEGAQGDAVRRVQGQLGVHVDGIDGAQTTEAVKTFQKEHGLTVDGVVGAHTWAALDAAAKLTKAHELPAAVAPAHAPGMPPLPPMPNLPTSPMPDLPAPTSPMPDVLGPKLAKTIEGTLSSAGQQAAGAFKAVYDAAVGDDINTIADPKAPILNRVVAGIDLATNVIDLPKGAAEVGVKLGVKAAAKGVEEAGLVVAGSAALQAAARLGQPAAPGAHDSTPVPPGQTTTAPAAASMHVRYAGEDREMANGYRQSGKIVSVEDGIVTQSTGRSTAEYKLSELTAGARDPAAIEKMLEPGHNVVIAIASNALQVTSLDQHHERTQVQAR